MFVLSPTAPQNTHKQEFSSGQGCGAILCPPSHSSEILEGFHTNTFGMYLKLSVFSKVSPAQDKEEIELPPVILWILKKIHQLYTRALAPTQL